MLDTTTRFRPPAPVPHERPLGLLGLIRALSNNPLEAWTAKHFDQPIVTTSLPFGRVAVVSDPAAIRRILVDNAGNYCKDALQRRMLLGLKNGLLAAEGEQWKFQRRTLAPIFSRKTVQGFAPSMVGAVTEMTERWRQHEGDVTDVAADVAGAALQVLEQTIFSDGLGYGASDIRDAMRVYFDTIGRIDPFDLLGVPAFVPRFYRLRARPSLRLFEQAVDTMVAQRRRRLADAPSDVPRDLLTLLIEARDPETGRGMTEEEIRANVVTFISAGHESATNAVSWTLFLLSQSQVWAERVRTEADNAAGIAPETRAEHLPETRAVIDEALRLYPPLAAISRVAVHDDELAGEAIRAGTIIVISPYILHRHRLLWSHPDEFDPDRFLSHGRAIDRFAYLPFGGGGRGCIGQTFALQETLLMVSTILQRCDLQLAPGHSVWPVHRITLRPRGGLLMRVRLRARPPQARVRLRA